MGISIVKCPKQRYQLTIASTGTSDKSAPKNITVITTKTTTMRINLFIVLPYPWSTTDWPNTRLKALVIAFLQWSQLMQIENSNNHRSLKTVSVLAADMPRLPVAAINSIALSKDLFAHLNWFLRNYYFNNFCAPTKQLIYRQLISYSVKNRSINISKRELGSIKCLNCSIRKRGIQDKAWLMRPCIHGNNIAG